MVCSLLPPPPPTTPPPEVFPKDVTIRAVPPVIEKGKCSLLKYTSSGNSKLVISPDVGEVPAVPEGSVRVCPDETTTYCITGDGKDTACDTVTVIDGSDPDIPPPTGIGDA